MEEIIIIGNSGAARECHQLFTDCWWASPSMRYNTHFKGFLSYQGFAGSLRELAALDLGDMDAYAIGPHDRFIIGIGNPLLRRDVFAAMRRRKALFYTLVSPWAYVPDDCILGDANIVNSGCNFSGNTRIGDGNYFNGSVRLGHDVTIGSFNFFGPSTTVLGGARMGDANVMAVQSVLLEQGRIGNDNRIHPGAVLFKGCRNNCRMAGNPALTIMDYEDEIC